ncbi:MAG: hypothetical protein ABS75_24760 [Pelagibacterium sp. SCN 63-23]|nr:MAG: hypothetical protein ABS75_24760 [Pelagibacterium sp. SCN 63-23]
MLGSELTLNLIVMRLCSGLLIALVQGLVIAAAAVLMGDRGPSYDGRLTLNPLAHLDVLGLASIVLSGFGWGRPVAIEAAQLRPGRWGLVIAILASSLALLALAWLLLALVAPILTQLPYAAGLTLAAFARIAARLCVWMALFSLLPLPPLAGAHLLAALGIRLPEAAGWVLGLALLALSFIGVTRTMLLPLYRLVAPLVLGPDAII